MSIGSLFGVRVDVHPSWLVVFGLVVVSLVQVVGGPETGRLATGPAILVALLVAGLLFASVLAHELAHAIVARRRGIRVTHISLFLFGGATRMAEEPADPTTEGLIAVAGPLASGAIGLVCLGIAVPVDGIAGEPARVLYWACYWLGIGNLLLAGFNLIPGFPMDGGLILRAVAWGVTGDQLRATRVASLVGRSIGYLMVFVGFLLAIEGSVVGGLWLVLVGWFLVRAARGSYNQVRLEQLVDGLVARDALETGSPGVVPTLTLDTLVEQDERLARGSGVYPVTVDGRLLGIVDVADADHVPRRDWPATRVEEVMRREERMRAVAADQPLIDVVARFEETRAEAFPVLDPADPGRLLGLVTRERVLALMRTRAARLKGAGGLKGAGAR